MYSDSSVFISWASACTVTRGPQDASNAAAGTASAGDASNAAGKADLLTVSLGDGGSAICTFASPIVNGNGPDFAVFENSINDSFLELAFVEVSSDGVAFTRFKSHSLTDTTLQVDAFGSVDATKIDNLAGKYRGGYGTPFDLQQLAGTPGLDINRITHVRVTDVVGSIQDAYASRDGYNNKVNDPWPTPFPSSGFDLDAIGVIHSGATGVPAYSRDPQQHHSLVVRRGDPIIAGANVGLLSVFGTDGRLVHQSRGNLMQTDLLPEGSYLMIETGECGTKRSRLLVY